MIPKRKTAFGGILLLCAFTALGLASLIVIGIIAVSTLLKHAGS